MVSTKTNLENSARKENIQLILRDALGQQIHGKTVDSGEQY